MGDELVHASVDLYWLPLGAGGHFVRWNGRLYEWWAARREQRALGDLYHCGLMLCLDNITYAVEMGPVSNVSETDRGVLVVGPVGSKWLGRFPAFRYEMRCWLGAASRTSPKPSTALTPVSESEGWPVIGCLARATPARVALPTVRVVPRCFTLDEEDA
jgi:hypothetical protein